MDSEKSGLINSLQEYEINGSKQWVLTSTKKEGSPILLFIHGGPGSVLMPFSHVFDTELWENFTVVHWDQRLSGKSYQSSDIKDDISIDNYVQDCLELVKIIKRNNPKSKIYMLGHSWGSIIGVLSANRLGSTIDGYIGIGQLVNDIEGQKVGYKFIVDKSKGTSDQNAVTQLGLPPYLKSSDRTKLSDYVMKFGGIFSKVSMQDIGQAIMSSPHYSRDDLEKQALGFKVSQELLVQKILEFDAVKIISELKIQSWLKLPHYHGVKPN